MSRGVVYVHSAPAALCPHVQWTLSSVLDDDASVGLEWIAQPAQPGTFRAERSWSGAVGTAARVASALRGWAHLRFEVTEDASPTAEGARFSGTPSLGIFHAVVGLHGDVLVPEDRLRTALGTALRETAAAAEVQQALDALLGKAWDDELEPFRQAGEGAPVRWLHHVG